MHARCDTDPLDFATELCEQCGGEYCDDHLLYPYGPKRPPLCKTCAIAVGGVRSGAAVARKRSRSQVKRRRAELRSLQHERRSASFEFFEPDAPFQPSDPGPGDDPAPAPGPAAAATDNELPASAPEADVVPQPAGRTSSLWRRRRSTDTPPPAAPEPEPEPEPRRRLDANLPDPTPARTSATVLLTRLRESGAVPPSVERRGRTGVDVLATHRDRDDELPPGWATPAQEPQPLADPGALFPAAPVAPEPLPAPPSVPVAEQQLPVVETPFEWCSAGPREDEAQRVVEAREPGDDDEPALEALAGSDSPSAVVGEAPPEVPTVVLVRAVSEIAPTPPPLPATPRSEIEEPTTDEVWAEDIDMGVELVPAPLPGRDPLDPPVVPEWLLRTQPLAPSPGHDPMVPAVTPLTTINSAHDLVLPPPPPLGASPADGDPWVPPALRGVDQPLAAQLLEAAETDRAALVSTFDRAIASHPAVQPEAQPTAPGELDDDDDPWAEIPPALRGAGWRPTEC